MDLSLHELQTLLVQTGGQCKEMKKQGLYLAREVQRMEDSPRREAARAIAPRGSLLTGLQIKTLPYMQACQVLDYETKSDFYPDGDFIHATITAHSALRTTH